MTVNFLFVGTLIEESMTGSASKYRFIKRINIHLSAKVCIKHCDWKRLNSLGLNKKKQYKKREREEIYDKTRHVK